MVSDSKKSLRRAIRKNVQGLFFKITVWTLLGVGAELLAIDFGSMTLQYMATGGIGQPLLIDPGLLPLGERSDYVGPTVILMVAGLAFSLLLAILLAQVADRLTRQSGLIIATDLRTRLFRETHRTSGQLITPNAMPTTMALIETAAIRYGQVVAGNFRHRRLVLLRNILLICLLAMVRVDWAAMIAAGAVLINLLKIYHSRHNKADEARETEAERAISDAFREELRESHQARVIGSPQGKGRPSDEWINIWEERDRLISEKRAYRHANMRLARLSLICLVVATIALTSIGQPMGAPSLLAILSIVTGGMILRSIAEYGRRSAGSEEQWLDPIHQALHESVRIWDVTDATTMRPCGQYINAKGLPMGVSPDDPRSVRKFSFEIPAHKVTAIVCPDVKLRRKLMHYLGRWEDPFAGEIQLDGLDLRQYSIASTRLQIGSIRSDSYLNNGPVLENITLNDPSGDLMSAIAAARDVHAHRIISKLPNGYQTMINADNPFELPVYDQFLIALARGRWNDPSVLLVEEPAQSMSRGIRELLRDSYRRLARQRTLVIFTRHAASVLAADHVIIIGNRKVLEGTPADLVQTNKNFRRAMLHMGMGLKPKGRPERNSGLGGARSARKNQA